MAKIDLITGFLGSGKTTFIREYAKHLLSEGQRIAILENDYGAINVDMMLLGDLQSDNCDLEMVVGGNDYDCHRRRFRSKLIALGMLGYDRVLVEPSGVYDVDEFFDVLHEEPLDAWYEIGSVISLVEADLEEDFSDETDYLLVSQTADAGILVLTKADGVPVERRKATIGHVNRAMEKFHCSRRFTYGEKMLIRENRPLDAASLSQAENAGYVLADHIKLLGADEYHYDSLFYMDMDLTEADLRDKITRLMADEKAGHVFRVKGFYEKDGHWFEVNATRTKVDIRPVTAGQKVIIVIGEGLNKEVVNSYWNYQVGSGKEILK